MNRRLKHILILIIEVSLWNTIVMKPIRLFSVFLHELGHAVMVMLFGGKIQSFQISLNESGSVLAVSRGWFATFMIANGGYLGGVLLSILILSLGYKFGGKYVLGVTALIFVIVAVVFSGISQTLLYATIFLAAVMIIFLQRSKTVENTALDIIGLGALTYGIYDTFVDTILFEINKVFSFIKGWSGTGITDAVHLRNITGIPAILWGVIWLTISLSVTFTFLFKSSDTAVLQKSGRVRTSKSTKYK